MYNNNFYEYSVGPKKYKSQKAFFVTFSVLKWIFIVISVLFAYCGLFLDNGFWILTAFSVASAVLFFFAQRAFYNYYDYIFIEDEVRIIKVLNNKRRKKVLAFGVKSLEKIGLVNGKTIDKYLSQKTYKKVYCTPNTLTENDVYFIVNLDKKYILFLEYDEMFLTNILKVGGVKLCDEEFLNMIKGK